jgi:hypothetical protein
MDFQTCSRTRWTGDWPIVMFLPMEENSKVEKPGQVHMFQVGFEQKVSIFERSKI